MMAKLLALIPALIGAMRDAMRLSGAVQSRTTRSQWTGNAVTVFIASVLVAVVKIFVPDTPLDDNSVAVGFIMVVAAAIGPLVSRALGFRQDGAPASPTTSSVDVAPLTPHPVLPDIFVRAKMDGAKSWNRVSGSCDDLTSAGYIFGVSADGAVWNLLDGLPTGEVVPLPKPATDPAAKDAAWDKLREDLGDGRES